MAFALGDRVKESSTSTGTGDITLAGAATGYRTFASVMATGDTTWYAIALGADWEVGLGTLSAATTLQRTTVLASSNNGALVSFAAGSKEVFQTAPATVLAILQGVSTNGRSLITAANYAAMKGLLAIAAGDITDASANGRSLIQGADYAAMRGLLGLNTAGAVSFRNRIRSGAFGINLRNVSGTVTLSAGQYGHDGFKAGANGCTYTFSKNNGVTTFNITAGTLLQVIEGALYVVEGGTYALSWVGTAPARVYQGSATGTYATGPLTVLGLAAETNTTAEWGVGSLSLPQFEPGTKATTFERRDDEVNRNYRYQQPVIQMDGIFLNSTTWYGIVKTVPTMAFTPALVLLNGTNTLGEYQNNTTRNITSIANPLYSNTGGDIILNTSTANSGARAALYNGAIMMRAEL